MARSLRVEFNDALYHVTSRGNARQKIFFNDADRVAFLKNLAYCLALHNVILHAYVLMGNHYHLLVETPDANLSAFMRDVNGNYSQWFNYALKRVGHLFQGRYKAFVIDKDAYLFEVARYIILNPVRAGLVSHPRDWKWSSYRATAGHVKHPDWLTVDWILSTFTKNRQEALKQYRMYIKEGIGGDSPFDDIKEGVILGDREFVYAIWSTQTNGSEEIKEIPRSERIVGRPSLEEIFDGTETRIDRNAAILFARERCGYSVSSIARHLGISVPAVSLISRGIYHQK